MQTLLRPQAAEAEDQAALNRGMKPLHVIECDTLYSIKGGTNRLGWVYPGDLFIEVQDTSTPEAFDAALAELDNYTERQVWLITHAGNQHEKVLAQRAKFMRLYDGVWYKPVDAN